MSAYRTPARVTPDPSREAADAKPMGTILREAREAKGLTLRALAALLGVSAPFWSDVEHSRRCPEKLEPVADALGINVAVLNAADPRRVRRGEMEELRARVTRLEDSVARMSGVTRRLR